MVCHWLVKWPWTSHLTSLNFTFFTCPMRMRSMYLVGLLWGWNKIIFIKQPCSMTSQQGVLTKRGYTCYKVKGWYRVIRWKVIGIGLLLFSISYSVLPDDIYSVFRKKGKLHRIIWVGWERGRVLGVSSSVCLALCNPMDCSPPGSSVHGIPARKEGKDIAKCTAHLFPFLVDCCRHLEGIDPGSLS